MRDHLVFYVNGIRHLVRGEQAALTLSDYLRTGADYLRTGADYLRGGALSAKHQGARCLSAPSLTGTKVACAEGDCGACSVLVGKPDFAAGRFEYQTIDACIAFVYQMDGRHVVTVEGIQQEDGTLSQVQTAMVDCHGSQCGFCTPGFVMALHGLLETRQQQPQPKPLTDDELRLGLSGNLCRCTGYHQILEAGHSCDPAATASVSAPFDTAAMLADFSAMGSGPVCVNARAPDHSPKGATTKPAAPAEIFIPSTLSELLARRAERPVATLLSGATDLGVQYNHGKISLADVLVTSAVPELDQLEVDGNELIIGAAVSWSRIERFVRDRVPEYFQVLTRFGSPQVRHAGTLAGNLANASPIADSIPFHYVTQTTLELASIRGRRRVKIEDFYLGYKQLDLQPDEVIVSVRTPLPTVNQQLKLYKISKRRDLDISTVTAAFLLELDGDQILGAQIATGGVGPTVVSLPKSAALLVGQSLSATTMQAAGRLARQEITPISDVRGSANYRLQLVENLFLKCFHDLCPSPPVVEAS